MLRTGMKVRFFQLFLDNYQAGTRGAHGLIGAGSPDFANFLCYVVNEAQGFLAKVGNPVRIDRVAELYRGSCRVGRLNGLGPG